MNKMAKNWKSERNHLAEADKRFLFNPQAESFGNSKKLFFVVMQKLAGLSPSLS
jgi:hypothetical protein